MISANQALTRLLNCHLTELLGKHYDEVICWKATPSRSGFPDAGCQQLAALPSQRDVPGGRSFAPGRSGGSAGRDPIRAAFFSNEGTLLNIIASVRDITRYREAEEMKTGFISTISHELKTPIALIKGYASTLRRDDVQWEPEIIQESLQVIEDEADHLARMVDDLLVATKLQSGDVVLKKSEFDLIALVKDQINRFNPQLQDHEIVARFPANFPLIVADEGRVEQLISNLITNALKYAKSGEICISGEVLGDFVQVCVTDQGKGFDPKDIPFVFDRFYRSDEDSKFTKGTGLGLYLAKAVVKAHQGQIWVDESYKQGARICFTLPIHAE